MSEAPTSQQWAVLPDVDNGGWGVKIDIFRKSKHQAICIPRIVFSGDIAFRFKQHIPDNIAPQDFFKNESTCHNIDVKICRMRENSIQRSGDIPVAWRDERFVDLTQGFSMFYETVAGHFCRGGSDNLCCRIRALSHVNYHDYFFVGLWSEQEREQFDQTVRRNLQRSAESLSDHYFGRVDEAAVHDALWMCGVTKLHERDADGFRNVVFYDEQRDFFFGNVQVISESQLGRPTGSESAHDQPEEISYPIDETDHISQVSASPTMMQSVLFIIVLFLALSFLRQFY